MIESSSTQLCTDEGRTDFCRRVFDAQQLLISYGSSGRRITVDALERDETLWAEFNQHGYSMLPWEMGLNGWLTTKPLSLRPPSWQLVLAHPSLGLEFGRPLQAVRRLEVGLVEPLGVLFYRGDRRSYWGVTSVVSVPSGEDFGFGGMLHLGKTFKAGYVGRKHRQNSGVLLSADFYKLISKRAELFANAQAGVEKMLESLKKETKP